MTTAPEHLRGTTRAPNGRWKAQISIDGKPKYLGTYDTQQKAHEVYTEALEQRDNRTKVPTEESPKQMGAIKVRHIYTYEGGVGAGCVLNGRRFMVNKFLSHNITQAQEVLGDGSFLETPRRINPRFLNPETEQAGPQPDPEPTLSQRLEKEILRLQKENPRDPLLTVLNESLKHIRQEEGYETDALTAASILKGELTGGPAARWLASKTQGPVSEGFNLVQGSMSPQEGLRWLRENAQLPPQVFLKINV